jgi:hypothetical protein
MSKGGAGKVYFILYLAVLLELLIIIVERDDAEDAARRRLREIERNRKKVQLIAETIINALRGSQTSVSSTSNQQMVLGDEKEADGREFLVKVRVSDPERDSVNDLSLAVYKNGGKMDSILMGRDTVTFPRVRTGQDYIFRYKFKPVFGEGEYALRFHARTNQVVGVAPGASKDDTVKIGAVRLTVGDLLEVKDGITENVQLRGFIDSLLNEQYANFSTNLGMNEFTVNVKKKEAKVFDQLAVHPQISDFNSFPTLDLPNLMRIEGAESRGVSISKLEGPGEFVKIDTFWYWKYTPNQGEVGQTYTVKYRGSANRGGGPKDVGQGQFSVTVKGLQPVDALTYFPADSVDGKLDVTPYTKVPFKVNGKYQDLNGTYRIKLTLDGNEFKTVNEPTYEFTPTFGEMEGKRLGVEVQFRSQFMNEFVTLKKDEFTITAPPFNMNFPKVYYVGDPTSLTFKAGYGIEGYFTEIGSDLSVSSDGGVFETKAAKKEGVSYGIRILKNPSGIDKKGKDVSVTVTDPATGQSKSKTIRFFPKRGR